MNPTILLVIQALIQYGPEVAKEVQALLANSNPTQADWNSLFTKAQARSYDSYISGIVPVPPANP